MLLNIQSSMQAAVTTRRPTSKPPSRRAARGDHRSILFGGLPYSLPRIIATWIKLEQKNITGANASDKERAVITVVPAWPHALGINEQNWMKNLIARVVVVGEYKKIGLPTAETAPYVAPPREFCVAFTPDLVAKEIGRAAQLALK